MGGGLTRREFKNITGVRIMLGVENALFVVRQVSTGVRREICNGSLAFVRPVGYISPILSTECSKILSVALLFYFTL